MPFYYFTSVLSSVQFLKPDRWKTLSKTVNHSFVQLAALFESSRNDPSTFSFTKRDDPNSHHGEAVYEISKPRLDKSTVENQRVTNSMINIRQLNKKNTASSYRGRQIKF